MAEDSWRERALCATPTFKDLAWKAGAENDPSQVFFPITADSEGREFSTAKGRPRSYALMEARFERLARATCSACPVRQECLFWTMEHEEFAYGIAGGLDAENRDALLSADRPVIEQKPCVCGIVLFGVRGTMPNACSANCRGEK